MWMPGNYVILNIRHTREPWKSVSGPTAIPASDVDSVVVTSVVATVDITTLVPTNTPTPVIPSPLKLGRYLMTKTCGIAINTVAVAVVVDALLTPLRRTLASSP